MVSHPYHDVAIVGAYNTEQARVLSGYDSRSLTFAAGMGALADAGLTLRDVDGVMGPGGQDFLYMGRIGPVWRSAAGFGLPGILDAAGAIAAGQATTVLLAAGSAGVYTERASTAPWTRPANEFVVPFGMFTAAEFALMARRHMHRYGTKPEALATVAATIRNNGHVNPEAVYCGRGPFTPQDILDSRMVADPFHLLDCSMTSEGGCGIVMTTAERARDLAKPPVYVLGGSTDHFGPAYQNPPVWDIGGKKRADLVAGTVGRRASEAAFAMAGLGPDDVDTCEFYDPFSFEIIRQFEAFGFCAEGEGGDFVTSGVIEPGGRFPITTDGGLMAFSHGGALVQLLQRAIRGVQQVRGECVTNQVEGAEVAMCTGGGAGALFNDILLLGKEAG
ncbi:MAG TPA: thiolase family protein [Acidimicrobiia bacterium]|nr:thiolase family protein [Acidimicrobiia bacterium]